MSIPVKMTRSHQVTLPKKLLEKAGWLNCDFFVADFEKDHLILKPLSLKPEKTLASLSELRKHFSKIGVTATDVKEAVSWARHRKGPSGLDSSLQHD